MNKIKKHSHIFQKFKNKEGGLFVLQEYKTGLHRKKTQKKNMLKIDVRIITII